MAHVFVVVPGRNSMQGIVIGKNSNRPPKEVQEVVLEQDGPTEVKCTYKTVVAGKVAVDVILSKPVGMYGCEMGANSLNVAGATVDLCDSTANSGLIPQDILRLALERGTHAKYAVDKIGELISAHGEENPSGYVVADKEEAWYVEAVGKSWVAERLGEGVRVLPSSKHITVDYEKAAADLEQVARDKGWTGEGKVPWNEVFMKDSDMEKQAHTEQAIIAKYFQDISEFGVKDMLQVLRDVEFRISRDASDTKPTAASQVSVIPPHKPGCHWFTATPDATLSVFKPFIWTYRNGISALTQAAPGGDGKHQLYRLHEAAATGENKVISLLQQMEADCISEIETFLFDGTEQPELSEVHDLLKDCVEAEVKFYK